MSELSQLKYFFSNNFSIFINNIDNTYASNFCNKLDVLKKQHYNDFLKNNEEYNFIEYIKNYIININHNSIDINKNNLLLNYDNVVSRIQLCNNAQLLQFILDDLHMFI